MCIIIVSRSPAPSPKTWWQQIQLKAALWKLHILKFDRINFVCKLTYSLLKLTGIKIYFQLKWAGSDLSLQVLDGIGNQRKLGDSFELRFSKLVHKKYFLYIWAHSSKAKQKQCLTAFPGSWFLWIFTELWAEVPSNDLVYPPEYHIQQNFIHSSIETNHLSLMKTYFCFFGRASFWGWNVVLFCRHKKRRTPQFSWLSLPRSSVCLGSFY